MQAHSSLSVKLHTQPAFPTLQRLTTAEPAGLCDPPSSGLRRCALACPLAPAPFVLNTQLSACAPVLCASCLPTAAHALSALVTALRMRRLGATLRTEQK